VGTVFVKMQVGNPTDPTRRTTLELLVDTGAIYSIVPAATLGELGIEPKLRKRFRTADGRSIQRAFAEATFAYNGEEATSRVIFGEPEDATVLGVHALEALGLQVDPVTGKLEPSTLFLFLAGKKAAEPIHITCPHCNTKLEIDTELAAVLSHEPPPVPKHDFDEQLKVVSEAEQKRDEVFRQQMDAQKERARLLERKFEESFKKTKDQPVTKPLRDFDLE
jgi:clan AA aspartic protease